MKKSYSASFLALGIVCSVCLVVSNILAVKQFDLEFLDMKLTSTAGLIIFPISYIINDCISEVWGYRNARLIIWLSFIANLLAVVMFQISVSLPPSEHWKDMQDGYAATLAQTPRIAVASLIGFLIGSFLNAYVMSKMKIRQKGKHFWLRAVVSTLFGELGDTMVFTVLAFVGIIPIETVMIIILTETVLKTMYEIVILPVTSRIVCYMKKHEEVDVYDEGISYNPFSLK